MMSYWIFILGLLLIPNYVGAYSSSDCFVKIKEDFHHEGDVVIGAFFPIHIIYTINKLAHEKLPHYFKDFHLQYNFRNYEFFLALVFAIEEINRNPHLLPNISLGFDFYNLQYNEKQILINMVIWLMGQINPFLNYNCKNEKKSAAVLTGTSWTTSAHIGTFLQLYKFPQLTFGPFDPILSEQAQFSSVYQMAPKDTFLSLALVSLLLHFHWTWVGLFLPDDHRGTQMLSDLREKMESNSICLAFVEMIPATWTLFSNRFLKNLGKIQESLANVIIIYGDTDSLQGLMRNLGQQFLTQKVWIMNSHWDVTNHADYFMIDTFHGSLIFEHHHKDMVEFTNFIKTVNPYKYPEDNYLPKLWFLFFKCPLSELDCQLLEICQPNASLEFLPRYIFNMAMSEESYNIYKAMYAVAQSLHELSLEQVQLQQNVNGKTMIFFPWQIPHSVCSESCGPGFRKAALEGKAVCCYDCTPCSDNEISNETDANQCVKCPENYFVNEEKNHCLQKAVSFLSYEESLGMILTSISLCFSALTAVVLAVFVNYKDTPIMKANNRTLSYTLLLTLITCFLCPLLFIGQPKNITCILQQTTLGGAFTVALATVLAKAITVVIAFRVTFPGRVVRWLILSRAPNFIIPICFLIQLVLCGIWLGTSPPFIEEDAHSDYEHIIIVCNMGSVIAFHCVLGYLCSLAFGSYIMAFLSRNLPDTFNEAKFLSFSMLVFFCVWITFLPVYHSTKGKVMAAMEAFTILASSAALLGFIFAPKCYIIFFQPDKNSLDYMRKIKHSRKKGLSQNLVQKTH
ncbi:vomeronasal type-2 receptor 116-like [Sigmodon hispidus]